MNVKAEIFIMEPHCNEFLIALWSYAGIAGRKLSYDQISKDYAMGLINAKGAHILYATLAEEERIKGIKQDFPNATFLFLN